jgi:hypothetical protein
MKTNWRFIAWFLLALAGMTTLLVAAGLNDEGAATGRASTSAFSASLPAWPFDASPGQSPISPASAPGWSIAS